MAENEHWTPSRTARQVGPWLLWFAVLGGSLAWAVHLLLSWGVVELACLRGHGSVLGLSLTTFTALCVALPLAVTLAATALSWRLWRGSGGPEDVPTRRARFLAGLGLAMNLLAVAGIAFGGAALVVLDTCAT
jgi:hypothetical protein